MASKNSRILKVAGLSFIGFCAVSIGVDRANLSPIATQLAGFCGAFVGGWVGARRQRLRSHSEPEAAAELAEGHKGEQQLPNPPEAGSESESHIET